MASPAAPALPAREVPISKKDSPARRIYRVPDYINPEHEHFKAKELRLGLHTHVKLVGTMDSFKVDVARMVVRGLDKTGTASASSSDPLASAEWAGFIKDLQLELEGAEATYEAAPEQDPPELPHLPGSLLALDALFLCAYLRSILDLDCWGYRFRSIFRDDEFEARKSPLYRDMTIMGNQVPMSLLLAVIKQLGKAEASRKGEKPADDSVDAGETRKHDEGERLLGKRVKPGCCLLLHSNHMNNQGNGKTELVGKGGDKLDAKAMLNKLLIHVVAAVYPFTHGDKVKTWKKDLKGHLEMHHKPGIPDALCDCEHILAATYLAICGGFNPQADDEVKPSLRSRFFCQGLKQGSDVEDHTIYRISSATSLKKCGIRFKAIDRPVGLDKMQFDNHSTLRLPKLVMNDHTAALFRNLALYEQMQHNQTRSDFRTYLYFMDSLMDEAEDVRLLIKSGVIVNQLGSDEDVCRQWNGMCEGLFIGYIPPQHMQTLQERIGDHLRAKHNQWIADFKERHCENPVRFLAYVAASLVTVATALQAIMAFVAYFHPKP